MHSQSKTLSWLASASLLEVVLAMSCFLFSGQAQQPQASGEHTLIDAQSELNQGNYAKAENLYKHLLLANPQDRNMADALAMTLYLQGKDTEAIRVLTDRVRTKPDAKAYALLASSNCRLGRYGKATDALRHLKPWPEDDALLIQVSSCATLAGEPLDGIAVYQKLIAHKAQPEDEFAVGLARAYIQSSKVVIDRLKDLPGSAPYIQAIDSGEVSGSSSAASAFEEAQRMVSGLSRDMSINEMDTLLHEDRNSAPATYGVGVILGERGMAAYLEAESRFPGSVPLLLFQADMLISRGLNNDAIAKYREILQQHPDSPGIHFRIGKLYGSNREFDQALSELRIQERMTPKDERVREAISSCLISENEFPEAYRYLKSFAVAPDASETILINFATSAENTDHIAEASKALLRLKTLEPASSMIRYRLFQFYKSTHDGAKAAAELDAYIRLRGTPRNIAEVR